MSKNVVNRAVIACIAIFEMLKDFQSMFSPKSWLQ